MSGNVCFHFLLPSMNSTYGSGLGLDLIHTEADQKHLFPEINLSTGNELYIHVLEGTYTYVLHMHIYYALQTKYMGRIPKQVAPSLWKERAMNAPVSFKGHLEKSDLTGKLRAEECSGSEEKGRESRVL